jgi:hypothetical protein
MADISKCAGGELCSMRLSCWRYLAEPHGRQSYILPSVIGDECDYYAPIAPSSDELDSCS